MGMASSILAIDTMILALECRHRVLSNMAMFSSMEDSEVMVAMGIDRRT